MKAASKNFASFALICILNAGYSFHTSLHYVTKVRLSRDESLPILKAVSDSTSDFSSLKERLFLYNTLSREKQLFTAIDKSQKRVAFYR